MSKEGHSGAPSTPQRFPSTHWSWIVAVQDGEAAARRTALEQLISLYWEPVCCWFVRYGFSSEDAKDSAQDFFVKELKERGPFHRAKHTERGFRPYLRKCLRNSAKNATRTRPPKMLSIDIHDAGETGIDVFDTETPEDTFNRAFARELLLRVMKTVEQRCRDTGREALYESFRKRIVEPSLTGAAKPRMMEFIRELGVRDKKQGSNRLRTVQRMFERELIAEIQLYAGSEEEVASELRELFNIAWKRRRRRRP